MIKILTVCLGNICRSPIAEEVLRKKCEDLNMAVELDSSGTADYHVGLEPDKRMIQTAKKFGYDISKLRARQFRITDFTEFDYIFVMDESNRKNVLQLTNNPDLSAKVFGFQEFAEISSPNFVPDPYYGTERDFIETFEIVEKSASRIAQKLNQKHNS